jgi:hypothetical protein
MKQKEIGTQRKQKGFHHFRKEIELMVASSPDPRLISRASFNKPAPCVPSIIVMERIVIGIGKITHI